MFHSLIYVSFNETRLHKHGTSSAARGVSGVSDVKLRKLRYFAVLAEELHYGRAADRLCITQPPLSAAIKSLEDELDVRLFERTSRAVRLTPAGEAYLSEVRIVLDALTKADRVAQTAEQGATGHLTVGFGGSLIFRGIAEIIENFSSQFPRIEIELIEMPQTELLENLKSKHLDVGFTSTPSVPASLCSTPLPVDEFAVCLPLRHPLAHRAEIDLMELAQEKFVMVDREISPLNYEAMSAIFHRAGIHPKLVHRTRGWLTIMAMVSMGSGIALLPSSLARAAMGGIRFVALRGPRTQTLAKLVWRQEPSGPLVESFVEFSKTMLKHMNGSDESGPA